MSFASPCVVPLVPGYLSYLTGLVGAEAEDVEEGGRTRTPGPRAGWSARRCCSSSGSPSVFLAQSAVVLGVARTLTGNLELLTRIGGGRHAS